MNPPPTVPAGIPSQLLERRPDIREAEQNLRSASARIGIANANFFPRFGLTALLGRVSPELSSLAADPRTSGLWPRPFPVPSSPEAGSPVSAGRPSMFSIKPNTNTRKAHCEPSAKYPTRSSLRRNSPLSKNSRSVKWRPWQIPSPLHDAVI